MNQSDNQKLLCFDPTGASDEQVRAWLFALIDAEVQKDKADEELILACSECESYLAHDGGEITEEEYARGLALIKQKAASRAPVRKIIKSNHGRVLWRVLLVAAIVLLICSLSVGTSLANSGSPAWNFLMQHLDWLAESKPGESIDGDKVSMSKSELEAQYASIDEARQNSGFAGMLYPTRLPEGTTIERILLIKDNGTAMHLTFVFSDGQVSYSISNYDSTGMSNGENAEVLTVGDKTCYYVYVESVNLHQACIYKDGYEHHVTTHDYDLLIDFIQGLTE
ncbi:MAG: hypothetical protein E7594_09130 [Ruminococcaceae bacterium]|nr:hypothetical protein [Oscillospiraceae bacterium]